VALVGVFVVEERVVRFSAAARCGDKCELDTNFCTTALWLRLWHNGRDEESRSNM